MLASHLKMGVKEMLTKIDSKELTEWMAYYNLEPFGEGRADVRQAITSCVVANAFSKQTHRVDDFIPQFKQPKRKDAMDWQVMKGMLQGVAKLYENGKVK